MIRKHYTRIGIEKDIRQVDEFIKRNPKLKIKNGKRTKLYFIQSVGEEPIMESKESNECK